MSEIEVRTLARLAPKIWCRVAAHGMLPARLMALGFLPHEQVRVVRRSHFKGGPLVIQIGNAVFALRSDEAEQIRVECGT